MRLIDADAIMPKGTRITPDNIEVAKAIRFAPTVDAVPVVRCRECKMRFPESISVVKHCTLTGIQTDDDDFCSYGERRC